jgi:hypothetical protein
MELEGSITNFLKGVYKISYFLYASVKQGAVEKVSKFLNIIFKLIKNCYIIKH